MSKKTKYFKFWLSILQRLRAHGELFDSINGGAVITIFYDERYGKYAVLTETFDKEVQK